MILANAGATNNLVLGNFIGSDVTGTATRNNFGIGLWISSAAANTIGGTNPAARNLISGNSLQGIRIDGAASQGNQVLGNLIGTDVTGTLALANATNGITFLASASGNTIGNTSNGGGNIIAFNNAAGVGVLSGTNNVIRGNSIFSNAGLGIDLATNGVTPNDLGDGDTNANFQQNFPVLTNGLVTRSSVVVQGALNSRSNTVFQLDFYANLACDGSGNGEGQSWLTNAQVTTDSGGNKNFEVTLPVSARDMFITATATDPSGNSSEFSACFQATVPTPPVTLVVTNTNDSGPGSLRQAMLDVDTALNYGVDTIEFAIPGAGPHTIFPMSALPTPLDPVKIDGYTQLGTVPNTLTNGNNAVLQLQLDGRFAGGPAVNGLHFTSRSNIVRGLAITRFSGDGLELEGGGGSVIQDVWVGRDIPTGAPGGGPSASPGAVGQIHVAGAGDCNAASVGQCCFRWTGNTGYGITWNGGANHNNSVNVIASGNALDGVRIDGWHNTFNWLTAISCYELFWHRKNGRIGVVRSLGV